jgi:uncharacterized membrane protein
MDEKNLQLLISIFKDEKGAEKAIETLKAAHKDAESGIQAAVAVIKDQNSAIHYKDVGLTPAKGALGGVILGATLGTLQVGLASLWALWVLS